MQADQTTQECPACCIGCNLHIPPSRGLTKTCAAFGDCTGIKNDRCGLRSPPMPVEETLYMKELEKAEAQRQKYRSDIA